MTVIYSQHAEEQVAILEWADGEAGSFVDLGCYDGVTYSNTAALAALGWPGICVDAAPDAACACAMRYADCDDITVILGALAVDAQPLVTIHWSPGEMYSSQRVNERDDITTAPIQMAPLDLDDFADRVAALPQPRFLSIDLEGGSIAALGLLSGYAECVCVEANNPDDQAMVADILAGWTPLLVNEHNSIYAR